MGLQDLHQPRFRGRRNEGGGLGERGWGGREGIPVKGLGFPLQIGGEKNGSGVLGEGLLLLPLLRKPRLGLAAVVYDLHDTISIASSNE